MQKGTVLIAGGTGFIGTRLAEMLRQEGYVVRLLTRSPKGKDQFLWDPSERELEIAALQDLDFLINLAGEGIAEKRWTASRKKKLVESRVQGANLLFRKLEILNSRPEVYISASGIGYYGNSGEQTMQEDDLPTDKGFMVECCQKWEEAAGQMSELSIRTVIFRIGVVLGREGGALAELLKPLRFGLGVYFGDGKAWWSWVHRDDVCRAILWAMEHPEVAGTYNLVAPSPVRGKELVKSTARARKQWALFLPAPAFLLRLIFGEMAAAILNSNRVASEKLTRSGFEFQWPEPNTALRSIFAPQSHKDL